MFKNPFKRSKQVVLKAEPAGSKRSARTIIRKQPKREVSFQIADIKTGLQMAKNVDDPDRAKLLQIFEYIMRDGHLKSQYRTARIKVLSEPWLLFQGNKPVQDLSENMRRRWMSTIIESILDAEFYGYTLLETDEIDPANFIINYAEALDREYVSIEKQHLLIEGTINGPFLPYAEMMDELCLLEFGKRTDYGILLECAYNVIWKYYSRSDWSRGSEKYGMPILSIETDTTNDAELDRIESKAANFGTDGYIVTQAGDKATMIERTGQRMHDIWYDNIKLCNEEISKAINGQTASSDPKAFVGAAEVQERTMDDFTFSRMENISYEMNDKVLPFLRRKGFAIGEDVRFDYPSLIRERERRLNGPQSPSTDAKQKPGETEKEKEKEKEEK